MVLSPFSPSKHMLGPGDEGFFGLCIQKSPKKGRRGEGRSHGGEMIAAHLFPVAFCSLSELKQLLPPTRAARPPQ